MEETAVEWLIDELNQIKSSSTNMNGKIQFLEKEFIELIEQAKAMDKEQRELIYKRGYVDGIGDTQLVNSTIKNKLWHQRKKQSSE